LGQEVRVVDSGAAAIEALKTYPAEIIFSDISMPGMSGYELAKRLRRTPETEQIRLVAMTGYGQAADREKALNAGFDEHMIKPVDIHRLRTFLAELPAD
jgi:CheY-like chemotaxis protein